MNEESKKKIREAVELLGNPQEKDFETYCKKLKTNFKKLIRNFHSDKVEKDDAKEEMARKIIEANSTISNSLKNENLLKFFLNIDSLDENLREKTKNTYYSAYHWEEGLSDELFSLTNKLKNMVGSMKSLLMSLPSGTQTLYYKGLKFKVTTRLVGNPRYKNLEPDHVWQIHRESIEKINEIESGKDPLQLIFE